MAEDLTSIVRQNLAGSNAAVGKDQNIVRAIDKSSSQPTAEGTIVKVADEGRYWDNPFSASTEVARKIMESACQDFFDSLEKREKRRILGWNRQSVDSKLAQRLKEEGTCDIKDVVKLIGDLELEWKNKHGKARHHFDAVCKTLHAHRSAFKCVPNSNIYLQSLAGGLSMIVEASATHSEIAEELSASVSHLFDRASTCSVLVQINVNDRMLQQLGEIYRQLFEFLGETAKWFVKRPISRFFNSFNSDILPRQERAVRNIDRCLDLLRETSSVVDSNRLHHIEKNVHCLSENVRDIRSMIEDVRRNGLFPESKEVASRMTSLLESNTEGSEFGKSESRGLRELERVETINPSRHSLGNDLPSTSITTRAETEEQLIKLDRFICGSDGLSLTQASRLPLADVFMVQRLFNWMQNLEKGERLWIEFPWELGQETVAKTTSLGVISVASQACAPFLSYVCYKADEDMNSPISSERAGLLSMVYSLIKQLLQFQPDQDQFEVEKELLEKLDGSADSWHSSLELLNSLLRHTSQVRYVIVDGINVLETAGADYWCQELFGILFRHTTDPNTPTSFLFTTSGTSEVLFQNLDSTERVRTDLTTHFVERREREVDVNTLWKG